MEGLSSTPCPSSRASSRLWRALALGLCETPPGPRVLSRCWTGPPVETPENPASSILFKGKIHAAEGSFRNLQSFYHLDGHNGFVSGTICKTLIKSGTQALPASLLLISFLRP